MRSNLVLYSVLDWGLGHATRSVPVIASLLKNQCEVIIAGEGRSHLFLQKEFPECKFETLKGFPVRYPEKFMAAWAIRNFPAMMRAYHEEQKQTATLVEKYQPHLLISDHRYGFFHPEIKSILIAHQLRIQSGLLTGALFSFHKKLLQKFNSVWIPDFARLPGLSGELSHHPSITNNLDVEYIGPLSRLKNILPVTPDRKYEALVILSGPEPHRTFFETYIRRFFLEKKMKAVIVRGTPDENHCTEKDNITEYSSVSAAELKGLILNTPYIICRPGYSTIMDLYECGRNAILIPTPGQTEQQFLAKLHADRSFSICKSFNELDKKFSLHTPDFNQNSEYASQFNLTEFLKRQFQENS